MQSSARTTTSQPETTHLRLLNSAQQSARESAQNHEHSHTSYDSGSVVNATADEYEEDTADAVSFSHEWSDTFNLQVDACPTNQLVSQQAKTLAQTSSTAELTAAAEGRHISERTAYLNTAAEAAVFEEANETNAAAESFTSLAQSILTTAMLEWSNDSGSQNKTWQTIENYSLRSRNRCWGQNMIQFGATSHFKGLHDGDGGAVKHSFSRINLEKNSPAVVNLCCTVQTS